MTDPYLDLFSGPNAIRPLQEMAAPHRVRTAVELIVSNGLGVIPVVGPIAGAIVSTGIGLVNDAKMQSLLNEIATRLDVVCQGVVDLQAVVTDQRFVAAATSAARQTQVEHDSEKIAWLAAAAVNSGYWSPLNDARQRYFMDMAVSWTLERFQVFRIFADPLPFFRQHQIVYREENIGVVLGALVYGDDDWGAQRAGADMTDMLTQRLIDGVPLIPGPTRREDLEKMRLTELGSEFMAFLTETQTPAQVPPSTG